MFGKKFLVDLDFDSHELLYIISDFLKSNGISNFNTIDGDKLRGFGDAGMGIFEIEKKKDRDKKTRLHIDANSPVSADILKNLIEMALEHIEANKLYEVIDEEDDDEIEEADINKEICNHEFKFFKEDEIFGTVVSIYQCKKCNKLEFYKK